MSGTLRVMVLESLQHASKYTGGKVRFDVFARNTLTHSKAWDDFHRHVGKGDIITCDGLVWLPEHQNTPLLASEVMWNELVSRWSAAPIQETVESFFHRQGPGYMMDPRIALVAFGQYAGLNKIEVCHAIAESIAIKFDQPNANPVETARLSLTKMFGMSVADISTDYQSIVNFTVVAFRNARSEYIKNTLKVIGTQREQLCNELETLK